MGELLRAVCDATCIDSNPAFYTSRLEQTLPFGAAAVTFADRSTFIECKNDTWFLMMGWAQSAASSAAIPAAGPFAGVANWANRSAAAPFTLRDVKTGRLFSPTPVQKVAQNFNSNNFVTLPEYTLWPPSSLIEVIQNVQVTNNNGALNFYLESIVTLAGIEYKLPDRPGGYLNGRQAT